MISDQKYWALLEETARRMDTTPDVIEQAMKKIIDDAWTNPTQGAWLKQTELFGPGMIPTPKELVWVLSRKIRKDLEEI